ncbi:MAG: hypothetical protein H6995_02470 [Pseudomonadales bacterium]|nr:hypothetical protein [Pseudomonadales bacterium]MCP5213852.1 hypothetical protein [Pseudomonadales bacterium]
MVNLKAMLRVAPIVAVVLLLAACKTIPSSSSSDSGSSSSSSSGGGGSSSPSGSSPGMPSSGGYKPFPQSGQAGLPGKSGSQSSETAKKSDASAKQSSSAKSSGKSGDGSEDKTLSDALEEFERARQRGNADSEDGSSQQGEYSVAVEESDFPLIIPPSGDAGVDLERQEGIEGGVESVGSAQTEGEKVAVLDRQLEESYGQFEGMILRERGYVRDKENARGSNAVIDAGGVVGEEQNASGSEGSGSSEGGLDVEAGGPITGSGAGSRPEGGDQREGDYQQAATTHKPPPDIPDGSDDDVVARQLREAAMNESDAELREKLWDEYRKYKSKSKSK